MVFVLGECTLDLEQREQRRAGAVRALQPKAFTVPVPTSALTGPSAAYTPASLATKILARQQDGVGERQYATVVGAGIEGWPALHQMSTREEINDLLSQGFAQVVAEVHRLDGFLTQVTSHGGIALFGVSLACEDHVLRALYAALGMQRAFGAFAAAL
jgi:class 3 adenylate cyclase